MMMDDLSSLVTFMILFLEPNVVLTDIDFKPKL